MLESDGLLQRLSDKIEETSHRILMQNQTLAKIQGNLEMLKELSKEQGQPSIEEEPPARKQK